MENLGLKLSKKSIKMLEKELNRVEKENETQTLSCLEMEKFESDFRKALEEEGCTHLDETEIRQICFEEKSRLEHTPTLDDLSFQSELENILEIDTFDLSSESEIIENCLYEIESSSVFHRLSPREQKKINQFLEEYENEEG